MDERKRWWESPIWIVTLLFLLIIIIIMMTLSIQTTLPSQRMEITSNITAIKIQGSMSIDGGNWRPISLQALDELEGKHRVIIRGRFPKAVDDAQALLFYVDNLRFSMSKNGKILCTFGMEPYDDAALVSPGSTWLEVNATEISSTDTVEIILENVYRNAYKGAGCDFINSMMIGTKAELLQNQIFHYIWAWLLGPMLALVGVIALVLSLFCMLYKVGHLPQRILFFAFFCILGGLWVFIDANYRYLSLLIPYPKLLVIWDVAIIYLLQIPIILYYYNMMEDYRYKKGMLNLAVGFIIVLGGTFLMQLLHITNMAETQWIPAVLTNIAIAYHLYASVREAKKSRSALHTLFIFSDFPLAVCVIWDSISVVAFDQCHNRVLISAGVIITLFLQVGQIIDFFVESDHYKRELEEIKEQQISDKISIMLSQIQPHFLYNALAAIQALCSIAPLRAEEAIGEFAHYLRGNMDSLSTKALVPFSSEIKHLQSYLYIEKLRFEDRLKIVMQLEISDFLLPVLTLQPLVENAVRYGVTRRPEGGTITIHTKSAEDTIYIEINDDGVGFDPQEVQYDGRSHVGLDNVRRRLAAQCGGRMYIVSEPGKGTQITIQIPKGEGEKDERSSIG